MHLIVAVQEELPDQKMTGPIGDFVRHMSSKQYSVPFVSEPWAKIRPREIRLFDFTIPEQLEDEVLKQLAVYTGGKLTKLSKIVQAPLLKGLIEKTLGLKAINMDPYIKINQDPKTKQNRNISVRVAVIGKLEDGYTDDGVELL